MNIILLILDANSEIEAHVQSLLSDLFKAFDWVERCHNRFLFLRKVIFSLMFSQHELPSYIRTNTMVNIF